MNEFLLTDCHLLDPVQNIEEKETSLGIKDGYFIAPEELKAPQKISLKGSIVCPGFIDLHVHTRDPGFTHKETLETVIQAALNGGFTSFLAMANTAPVIDNPALVRETLQRASLLKFDLLQAGAITIGRNGQELTDFTALKQAGVPALTDDGSTPQSEELMLQAALQAKPLELPIIDHCEDLSLSKPGVMHKGRVSAELGLQGQPREAEEAIVARDISLAAKTGCHFHLQHLSSKGSIQKLQEAQQQGIPVTGEATPHHLFLTDEACKKYGVNAKMAPPLREEEDRQALIQALQKGIITILATDHAPHTAEEKNAGWGKAPFGIVGLEAAVPLCLTHLYHTGILSLMQLVSLFTKGPRDLLHRPIGSTCNGEKANLTLLDLDVKHTLHTAEFASKGRNCPYDGWECIGKATAFRPDNSPLI